MLAARSVQLWRHRRGAAAFWAMCGFSTLALIEIVGRVSPSHPHGIAELAAQRIEIALLLLFPYLLFRFTTAFVAPERLVDVLLNAMTVVMIVWTFVLPHFPQQGEARGALFDAYLAGFLVHWTVLSIFSSWRLWRAGRGQPSVARARMRLLAAASGLLTLALFLVVVAPGTESPVDAAAQLLAFVSALWFLLGLTPPRLVRVFWRLPDQRRIQLAIESLVGLALTREEVAERVLEPLSALIGGSGIALHDADGALLGAYNVDPDAPSEGEEIRRIEITGGGALTIWTTPYAPFFGEEELNTLEAMGALIGIALDRVRLFVQEREARIALERANEVMANFITLAAHELRTPVTSIHGFVRTLNHLGERLTPERRDEISRTLEEQTARMASLVEQLLDLSRLDADAIEIVPQRVSVRLRLDEIVAAAAPGRDGDVAVDADEALRADLDPTAFDRIVSNLVTNALRYGEPPVVVRAVQADRHLRVYVEDAGAGVPADFVPDLFERFARGGSSRAAPGGTGLGLAIARSYARAHGGDLLYERGDRGARFQFVLPTGGER